MISLTQVDVSRRLLIAADFLIAATCHSFTFDPEGVAAHSVPVTHLIQKRNITLVRNKSFLFID